MQKLALLPTTDEFRESPVATARVNWTTNSDKQPMNRPSSAASRVANKTDHPRVIKVLVVESSSANAEFIGSLLSVPDGARGCIFKIRWVSSLGEAAKHGLSSDVDVVLLDLNLRDSEGLETLIRLRAKVNGTPIVVFTSEHDTETATSAIRLGAQDFLVRNDITREHLSRTIRYALERHRRQRAEMEIAGAAFIQRRILSKPLPKISGFDIAARCEPALTIGGDFYDFIPLKDGALAMVIGDVSGHGLGPALLMAAARGILRSVIQWELDPGTVLTKVNHVLFDDCVAGAFVTVFLAVISVVDRTARYATAGHEGYLLDGEGNPKTRLAVAAPPLGVERFQKYVSGDVVRLQSSDVLLSCTDGITEGYSFSEGEFFGMRGVFDAVRANNGRSAEVMLHETFASVERFRNFRQDDMTAVLVKVR